MSSPNVSRRIAELEARIAELTARVSTLEGTNDWRSVVGMFTGDEAMKQIDAAGQRIREQDRQKARRRKAPKHTARS